MKKKLILSGLAVPVIAFLLLAFSPANYNSTLNKQYYSGKELFSVIFLQGKMPVDVIESLSRNSGNSRKSSSSFDTKEQILLAVDKMNPGFFHSFKEQIVSGDKIKVKDGILKGASLLKECNKLFKGVSDSTLGGYVDREIAVARDFLFMPASWFYQVAPGYTNALIVEDLARRLAGSFKQ